MINEIRLLPQDEEIRHQIAFRQANHFESRVVEALLLTGSVSIPNIIEARQIEFEKNKHNPDIEITLINKTIKLEVKQDGRALETGNIFVEKNTLEDSDFDFILYVPNNFFWEGNETKNFAYLFTKEQIRTIAITKGRWCNHAGDYREHKKNGGWIVSQNDLPETNKDKTFITLSREYYTTYARKNKEEILLFQREAEQRALEEIRRKVEHKARLRERYKHLISAK